MELKDSSFCSSIASHLNHEQTAPVAAVASYASSLVPPDRRGKLKFPNNANVFRIIYGELGFDRLRTKSDYFQPLEHSYYLLEYDSGDIV